MLIYGFASPDKSVCTQHSREQSCLLGWSCTKALHKANEDSITFQRRCPSPAELTLFTSTHCNESLLLPSTSHCCAPGFSAYTMDRSQKENVYVIIQLIIINANIEQNHASWHT